MIFLTLLYDFGNDDELVKAVHNAVYESRDAVADLTVQEVRLEESPQRTEQ